MTSIIFQEMTFELRNNLLAKWYPLVLDEEYGGYFSNISADWELMNDQDKMIVTQARHIWTLSKAYQMFNKDEYRTYALHGYYFLRDFLWDKEHGGFFQIRSRNGDATETEKYYDEKRTYGNAFAIYALSALYKITGDKSILNLAVDTFNWIEEKAYDPLYKGYFQFLTRQGKIFNQSTEYKTAAKDFHESNFKDQNSSIHLLEAYTELYSVWQDIKLKERLSELLFLIQEVICNEKGYLQLFFGENWKPVSFRNASKDDRENNFCLDHISFGHNYETAFLMLEASYRLNLKNDLKTIINAKRMLDHAVKCGWDSTNYGFFDEGYYFDESNKCTIIKDTKTWWQQAEGLNALLIFSQLFPEEKKYEQLFEKQWDYVKKYVIDSKNGGLYYGSIEKEPFMVNEPKGTIWKASYHDGRALMNCISILNNYKEKTNDLFFHPNDMPELIDHWREIASVIP